MPSVWHQPIPPDDHSQSRTHVQHIPAHDGSYLHYGCHPGRCRCVHLGSRRKAKSLHYFVPLRHDCWLHNVSRPIPVWKSTKVLNRAHQSCSIQVHHVQQSQGDLWWRLYRSLCHLPSIPWRHHMACQQPSRQL